MKTPWHLWLVGILSLLWNAMGAFDYVMAKTRAEAYLAQMTPEQIAYFEGFPVWATVAWAFGVWAALLGSVALLLRSRYAVHLFWLSFAGMAVNTIYGLLVAETPMTQVAGTVGLVFMILIVAVAILLILYSRAMTRRGVLR